MCGIFASAGFAPDRKRIDLIAHRGPDGAGWKELATPAGLLALGHRRLAIIDTSDAGLQPFSDAQGRYHLVYNGELYNYRSLRRNLEARGIIFQTQTDTEVLFQALIAWGADALAQCEGMFSFIFYDAQSHTLLAARDRFGIKPLYYCVTGKGIAFASEIKQLIGLEGCEPALNMARAWDFLIDGISDHTAETMFANVRQVRGGEYAIVDLGNKDFQPHIRRWYDVALPEERPMRAEEAAEQFRALLTNSVRDHLQADVTVGSCLSGGLDSSSIACLMAPMLGKEIDLLRTVTACYDVKAVNERHFAEMVAAKTGAAAHYIYPRADDLFKDAAALTWHQDEPFGSTSIFAQWAVFAEAKRAGIKVMLDGQGADEQLAGYHGMFGLYMRSLLQKGRLLQALRTQIERARWHGAPLLPSLSHIMRVMQPVSTGPAAPDWVHGDISKFVANRPSASLAAAQSLGLSGPVTVNGLCQLMVHASNLPMLLHWEDRNSMAHSIEARVPFLDHKIVEFSLSLPVEHKFNGGDTKRVLRAAMQGILPEGVRMRRDKLGFATPEEVWFKGALRAQVLDGVETAIRQFPAFFNAPATRAMAQAMLEGRQPFHFGLWRIVSFGLWGKQFSV